jgi:hypothetical protein
VVERVWQGGAACGMMMFRRLGRAQSPSAQQNNAVTFENQTSMPGCQARQSQPQPLTTWSLARACRLTICTAADRGSQHDGFFRTCFPQHSRHARVHCSQWMEGGQCWTRREEEQQHHHRLRMMLRSRYITVVHAVRSLIIPSGNGIYCNC